MEEDNIRKKITIEYENITEYSVAQIINSLLGDKNNRESIERMEDGDWVTITQNMYSQITIKKLSSNEINIFARYHNPRPIVIK